MGVISTREIVLTGNKSVEMPLEAEDWRKVQVLDDTKSSPGMTQSLVPDDASHGGRGIKAGKDGSPE